MDSVQERYRKSERPGCRIYPPKDTNFGPPGAPKSYFSRFWEGTEKETDFAGISWGRKSAGTEWGDLAGHECPGCRTLVIYRFPTKGPLRNQ